MTFTEIFNEDGLYISTDNNFRKGVAYKVKDRQLFIITYKDQNDLFPIIELPIVTYSTINRIYKKIYSINQLFK